MKGRVATGAALGLMSLLALPGAAFAQDGSEIIGQPLQVTTNGVTNTVYLDPGGAARIMTPGGNTVPWQLEHRQRAALPQRGWSPGMLALRGAVPGGAAADSRQLLQPVVDLDRPGDQHGAAAAERGWRTGQVTGLV
jgi:hypothetical protein